MLSGHAKECVEPLLRRKPAASLVAGVVPVKTPIYLSAPTTPHQWPRWWRNSRETRTPPFRGDILKARSLVHQPRSSALSLHREKLPWVPRMPLRRHWGDGCLSGGDTVSKHHQFRFRPPEENGRHLPSPLKSTRTATCRLRRQQKECTGASASEPQKRREIGHLRSSGGGGADGRLTAK